MANSIPANPKILQISCCIACTVKKRASHWNSCPEVYKHLWLFGHYTANHTFTPSPSTLRVLVWANNSLTGRGRVSAAHATIPERAANPCVPAQTPSAGAEAWPSVLPAGALSRGRRGSGSGNSSFGDGFLLQRRH